MNLRTLQGILTIGNGAYGGFLFIVWSGAGLHISTLPPTPDQQAIGLVALSVLPMAIVGFWFPVAAGILEFACAFVGSQLLHDSRLPGLRLVSSVSMTLALIVLGLAVFGSVLQVTREAFGETDDQDEPDAHEAA